MSEQANSKFHKVEADLLNEAVYLSVEITYQDEDSQDFKYESVAEWIHADLSRKIEIGIYGYVDEAILEDEYEASDISEEAGDLIDDLTGSLADSISNIFGDKFMVSCDVKHNTNILCRGPELNISIVKADPA